MIDFSRREWLASPAAAVLPFVRGGPLSVACTLEESRRAFQHLRPLCGNAGTGRVLVESNVGYAAEDLSWLRRFDISVGKPAAVRGPSWVRFSWPMQALIRDFGRVCPVAGGDVIAHLGEIPVATRYGRLIVLGSPLGPHIYGGDRDARLLLDAILRSSSWGQ